MDNKCYSRFTWRNFKPIKLLSPLYLTGTVTADVKSETINTSIIIPELLEKNNNERN